MSRKASHVALALVCFTGLTVDQATAQQPLVADAGFARQVLAPCPTDLHWINHISGWQVRWSTALESQPVDTGERRTALLETWRTAPTALAEATGALREGLRNGRGAPVLVVRRVLDQIDSLVGEASAESVLSSPARRSDDPDFARAWRDLAATRLEPAIRAYRDFLRQEYLPATSRELGLGRLPNLERSFPAGLYRQPAGPDDTARYFVNTSRPRDRRLLSEVIAFHETVPGHHTSFAVPAAAGAAAGGRFNSGFAGGWGKPSRNPAAPSPTPPPARGGPGTSGSPPGPLGGR